jgi:hypothetical protein
LVEKDKIIQDLCIELGGELGSLSNEEIAIHGEQKFTHLKPVSKPERIEILLGEKTL